MHTHAHTCSHMLTHAHTCTHMHTHAHTCTHCTCVRVHVCMRMSMRASTSAQLCINFANEKLQRMFTEAVFESILAEYKKEGIEVRARPRTAPSI